MFIREVREDCLVYDCLSANDSSLILEPTFENLRPDLKMSGLKVTSDTRMFHILILKKSESTFIDWAISHKIPDFWALQKLQHLATLGPFPHGDNVLALCSGRPTVHGERALQFAQVPTS